jgi:hypothetical protein
LIKLLVVHHLKMLGEDWDSFVARNGFITVNPLETPVMDKMMIEKPLIPSSDRPDFLCENPCERAIARSPLCEQQDASPRLIKTPEHEQIVFPNPTNKNQQQTLANSQRKIKR